ncbi:MAG: NUDIX domain-containing protein [Candidatus Baldrarchaeia archaeon]
MPKNSSILDFRGDILKRTPTLTVDAIIKINDNKIVLVKRKNPPYKGWWALPGGIVEYGETVEEAVKREVKEETGLEVEIEKLVNVYSDPNRDPRGHFVSICFLCRKVGGVLKAATDAAEVSVFSLKEVGNLKLAFDHRKMLEDAKLI